MWKKCLSVLLVVSILAAFAQPAVFAQDEDPVVRGEWSAAGHAALAESMNGLDNASIIKAISEACDSRVYLQAHPANAGISNPKDYAYRGCNAYHAIGNYVASARYLYAVARYYKYGTTITNPAAYDTALTGLGRSYEANNRLDIDSDIRYMEQYCSAMFPSGMTYYDRLATVAFGMLFHLLGDIYAHRSVVPVSSVSVTDRKNYGTGYGGNEGKYFVKGDFRTNCASHRAGSGEAYRAHRQELLDTAMQAKEEGFLQFALAFARFLFYAIFGRLMGGQPYTFSAEEDLQLLQLSTNIPQNTASLCGGEPCWDVMQRIAQLGVLQFKDIKYFLNDSSYKTAQAYYEDQAPDNTFYTWRYEAARAVMQQFVTNFNANAAFNPTNFLPIYTEQMRAFRLRIDCLYNYLRQTNSALDTQTNAILRANWWSSRDDSLFEYSTIVYNGSYFIDPATYPSGEKPAYDTVIPQIGMTAEDFYV